MMKQQENKMKILYKIIYQDVDSKIKTYMNNSAFSEDKADEEIARINRDFPERKNVTKKPVMVITTPENIDTNEPLKCIRDMEMASDKIDTANIKRAIKNIMFINIFRKITNLAFESSFIRSIDDKPLMFKCCVNLKHNFSGMSYMKLKSCKLHVLYPVDVIKQRIQEFVTYVKSYITEDGIDIKLNERESTFDDQSVPSTDFKTMNNIIPVSFVLDVSISDSCMDRMYIKTQNFLSTLS